MEILKVATFVNRAGGKVTLTGLADLAWNPLNQLPCRNLLPVHHISRRFQRLAHTPPAQQQQASYVPQNYTNTPYNPQVSLTKPPHLRQQPQPAPAIPPRPRPHAQPSRGLNPYVRATPPLPGPYAPKPTSTTPPPH